MTKEGDASIEHNEGISMMNVMEMDTKEKLTVEEVINKVVTKLNIKLTLLIVFAGLTSLSWAINVLSTAFAGQ